MFFVCLWLTVVNRGISNDRHIFPFLMADFSTEWKSLHIFCFKLAFDTRIRQEMSKNIL